MKHLRLFEKSYNENNLKLFTLEKSKLYDSIKAFIIEDRLLLDDEYDSLYKVLDFYFEKLDRRESEEEIDNSKESIIVICLFNADKKTLTYYEEVIAISPEDIPSLLMFIDNPSTYKTSKNFNL